jgi:hypothetical protein
MIEISLPTADVGQLYQRLEDIRGYPGLPPCPDPGYGGCMGSYCPSCAVKAMTHIVRDALVKADTPEARQVLAAIARREEDRARAYREERDEWDAVLAKLTPDDKLTIRRYVARHGGFP